MTLPARWLTGAALAAALILLVLPTVARPQTVTGEEPKASGVTLTMVKGKWARVSGSVDPGPYDATWWFEYGPTTAYGQTTAKATAPASIPLAVSAQLNGLTPATDYHVRLVAETTAGLAVSEDVTFTSKIPEEPTPDPSAPLDPAAPGSDGLPAPELAETVVVVPGSGSVKVRKPGRDNFRPLEASQTLPLGSVVDATEGSIVLHAAKDAVGGAQKGQFGGGRFLIRQPATANGYVSLHLRGGGLSRCGATRSTLAHAAATAPKRRLWGRDRHARFRTHGRDSVATVRGTRWSVTDRCGGTVTRVTEGAVDVKVRRTGRVVRVNAGESHFARHRR